ncbi:spartin-like [Uloborus diversus]|uniref:spartin-like n=1 Tax=Uloborus diversus TaxID=327109 RepID=UPI00240A1D0C|nr:spartin-like [Uloborus diversus]
MALRPSPDEITDEQLMLLETIRVNHDEAYLYISQGLSYQEQGQSSLARDMYDKGLLKIDQALNVRCDQPYCSGPKWDNARRLQQKMRKTAQMVRSEFNDVASPPYAPPELPPSYDEACEQTPRRSSCPGVVVATAAEGRRRSTEVVELFCVPDEVQLFYVSCDGSVSTHSSHTSLNVYQFVDHEDAARRPPAWLQVGSWTYPLIPGQSPALESGYGAFLFPDVGAGRDSAVGVILPPSVDARGRAEFLGLLNSLTALKEEKRVGVEEEGGPASFSESLSRGIVIGAEYISAGLVKGAALSSDLIHRGASKAREKISPEDKPVAVDPRVRQGLVIAREASGVALKATGFLVKKLGDLTVALGKQLAPHIREQGTKLLTSAFKRDPKDAQDTMDGVLTVAAGGLQGFSTVYMGLENAAKTLAYSLSSETVNIVDHKYGSEAGEVVGNAVFSIGNLALTTHNLHSLGPKSVAKRTAKDAGKAVLKDYVEHQRK